MATRNLLFVTYQFPPIGGSGVQRALNLARYLPQAGWRVHVISAGHTHYPLLDPTLACDFGDDVLLHRTCGLEPAGIATAFCKHWVHGETASDWLSGFEDRLYWRLNRMCGRLQLPETEMLWVPAAIRQARRSIDRQPIEAVVTTSPPHSTHLVGLSLHRRLGIPWIADLRDPMLGNFAYRARTRLENRFWRWLERSVVHHASAVVVTCPELADSLIERYPDVNANNFSTITNGWDPADAAGGDAEEAALYREPDLGAQGRFTLSYVGAFYREQTIGPILDAIRRLRAERNDIAKNLAFRLIGSLSGSQRQLLRADDTTFLQDVGYRPHEEAIAEMGRADTLLLTTPANAGGRLCIPAKAFEYLAFGGHILAPIHKRTSLWRILEEAGNATLLDCSEPPALARAIERCYDAWRAGTLNVPRNCQVVARYRRDGLAKRFAKVVEDCARAPASLQVAAVEDPCEEEAV